MSLHTEAVPVTGPGELETFANALACLKRLNAEAALEIAQHEGSRLRLEGAIDWLICLLDLVDAVSEDLEEGGDLEPALGAGEGLGDGSTLWSSYLYAQPDGEPEEDDPLEECDADLCVEDMPFDDEDPVEPCLGSDEARVDQTDWAVGRVDFDPWAHGEHKRRKRRVKLEGVGVPAVKSWRRWNGKYVANVPVTM